MINEDKIICKNSAIIKIIMKKLIIIEIVLMNDNAIIPTRASKKYAGLYLFQKILTGL